jgi:hypothetical protein
MLVYSFGFPQSTLDILLHIKWLVTIWVRPKESKTFMLFLLVSQQINKSRNMEYFYV